MRSRVARLLYRLAVHLDASVEPTVDLGDFEGGRYVKNLPASQIELGLDYIRRKYGPDAALTAWQETGERRWYAENAPQVVQHIQLDGVSREDIAAHVRRSLADVKRRYG